MALSIELNKIIDVLGKNEWNKNEIMDKNTIEKITGLYNFPDEYMDKMIMV
jgi:hypothetical protein